MDIAEPPSTGSDISFEKSIRSAQPDGPRSSGALNIEMHSLRRRRTEVMDAAIRKHMSSASSSMEPSQRPPPEQAVKILADAMLNSPDDEKLQLKAIISLVRMSAKDDEREIIGHSQCIMATIRAMKAFPGNQNISRRGCVFLANSAFQCQVNKDKIRDHGGIDVIIKQAMKEENDEELQLWTFLALRNLCNQSEQNQLEAEACGALGILQKGLRRYLGNKSLQTHGVASVASIAGGGLNCQMRLRETGCIDAVIESMKTHFSGSAFMEHCLVALTVICQQNENNQTRCWELGVVEVLADILRLKKSSPDLLLKVCLTVRQLCFNKLVRVDAGRAGIVNRILEEQEDIKNRHGAEGAVAVLKALSNAVCDVDENMKIFTRCGGTEAMMKLLLEFLANAEVLGSGLRLFRNICDETDVNYEYLKGSSVFKFSLDCIELFKDDANITEHAFQLVLKTLKRGLQDGLFGKSAEELRELVQGQLERLYSHAGVQKTCHALLKALDTEAPSLQPAMVRRKSSLLMGKLKKTFSHAM